MISKDVSRSRKFSGNLVTVEKSSDKRRSRSKENTILRQSKEKLINSRLFERRKEENGQGYLSGAHQLFCRYDHSWYPVSVGKKRRGNRIRYRQRRYAVAHFQTLQCYYYLNSRAQCNQRQHYTHWAAAHHSDNLNDQKYVPNSVA